MAPSARASALAGQEASAIGHGCNSAGDFIVPDLAIDVLCIGNAIVDVIARVDDHFVEKHGLVKGSMNLIDEARADCFIADMGQAIDVSGGSAGNTAAGVASFGGKVGLFRQGQGRPARRSIAHDHARPRGVFRIRGAPRRAGDGALLHPGDARRRAHDEHLSRRLRESHHRRHRRTDRRAAEGHLHGRLLCGTGPRPRRRSSSPRRSRARPGARPRSRCPNSFCVERHRDSFLDLIRNRHRHRVRQRDRDQVALPDAEFRRRHAGDPQGLSDRRAYPLGGGLCRGEGRRNPLGPRLPL